MSARQFPPLPAPPASFLLAALLCSTLALPANAADPEARLKEIAALSERDHARARTMLVQEGPTLIAGAPYALRIDYLRLLYRTQVDADLMREAHATNEQIARLAQAEGDGATLALADLARAGRHLDDGDPARALAALETLAARHRDLNSLEFGAGADFLYGRAYAAIGQRERALEHALRALATVRRHAGLDSPREADIRLALAQLHLDMLEPDKALAMLKDLRNAPGEDLDSVAGNSAAKSAGNYANTPARSRADAHTPRLAAGVALTAGRAMVARNDLIGALGAFDRALALARANALVAAEAEAQAHLAGTYLKLRRYGQADSAARAALAAARLVQDGPGAQMAQAKLGLALFGQGRQQDGLAQVDAVAARLRQSGALAPLARLLGAKAETLEAAGRYREALAAVREREAIADALAGDERAHAMAALQEQFRARERVARLDSARQESAARETALHNRSLRLLAASLGGALALVLCGVLWLAYRKSLRAGRRLAELNAELAYRSARDPLTGLFNRRSFQERMRSRTGEAAARLDAADCFTLLDIDHLKRINDEYGHAAGDAVLVEVGRRLRQATRESDMVLRWGGEEFLVYSQGVAPPQRAHLVRRFLDAIAATPVLLPDGTTLDVSATAGAVSLPFDCSVDGEDGRVDWEQAIALADRALFKGKEGGRNRAYLVAGVHRPEGAHEGLRLDLILPGVPA